MIYGMERFTYEKESLICTAGEKTDKLFLIQQGIIEVAIKYDKRRPEQYFVIERLGRGAIINHRSFMIDDDSDTDFVCRTNVSVFVLHYNKVKAIKKRRQDIRLARKDVKLELKNLKLDLALDYIFHNNDK